MSGELPKSWASAKLEEIVTAKKGKKPAVLRDSPADGFVPYLDIHAIEKNVVRQFAEVKSSKVAAKDDLFVVWDGARSGWVGGGITGAIGSTIMALTAQQAESSYVRHFIASQFQTLNNNTRGTGIPHVDSEVFWNLEVPLAPRGEQRRIVAKLEKLLGKVDASQQRLAKIPVMLKRFRQSVLAAACSGRLTNNWRDAHAAEASELIEDVRRTRQKLVEERRTRKLTQLEPITENEQPLPKPSAWEVIRLDELCTLITDGKHGDCRNQDRSGYYFLSVKDLKDGKLNYEDARQIVEADFLEVHQRTNLEALDVLISNSGTIGRVAIAQDDERTRRTTFQKSVAILKPLKDHLDSRFLGYYLIAAVRYIDKNSRGTAQKNLLLRDLKNLVVYVPTRSEQQEIVRRVEGLFALADQLEVRLAKARGQVDQLTPSLLARAFAGQLVPQDPNDEPASVLLKRIKEQKNGSPKNSYAKEKTNRTSPSSHGRTKRR